MNSNKITRGTNHYIRIHLFDVFKNTCGHFNVNYKSLCET